MYPMVHEANNIVPLTQAQILEIKRVLRSFLPSLQTVLTEFFFNAPFFLVKPLRDTAPRYELNNVPAVLMTLESRDVNCRSLITHIWFMNMLGSPLETIKNGVEIYRRTLYASRLSRAMKVWSAHDRHITPASMPVNAAQPTLLASDLNVAHNRENMLGQSDQPAKEGKTGHKRSAQQNEATQKASGGSSDDTRKAKYVFQHFRDNRVSGDLNQAIEITL